MNKNFIYIIFIGLIGFFSSCEKDETKVVLLANPVGPGFTTFPELNISRANSGDTLVFQGTPVDPGFQASAVYYLEADTAGNQFHNPIILFTGDHDAVMKITVNDFDAPLIKRFPISQTSALEFRIRSVITPDGGTGANDPIVTVGEVKSVNVKLYGPPTLGLTPDGHRQGITSPTDNKKYNGWIYTDGTAFTLTNLDDGKTYGGNAASETLTENGPAITLPAGAYNLSVDLTDPALIKMTSSDVTIGIIGDAVGGWDNDTKMVYNFADHTWDIRITVGSGGIKFRTHGGWSSVNVAYDPAGHDLNKLYQSKTGADSQNIDDITPGEYDVKLYLETSPMKVTFTPTSK